jgi:hypothetical protein
VMDPNYARLGLGPDHGDGAAFCGQAWENVSPGESHHNAYRMDGDKQRICTIWYWDELNRRKLKLYDVGEIEELGSGLGEASLTLKGDDTNIVRDAKGYNAYPVAGSPIIDAGAPLPEDVGAILERVGMELDAPVGRGYDIGANEYAGERERVRLSAPKAGTAYLLGRSLEIAWEASDFVGLVQIHLSRDGGATWEVIKDGVPASWGTYCWKVSGATSREALVRLTDYGGHEYDVSEPFLLMAR